QFGIRASTKRIAGRFNPFGDVGFPEYMRLIRLAGFPSQFQSIDPAGLLATPMNQRNGDRAIDFLAGSPKGIIDPESRDWYRRKHGLTNNRICQKAQIWVYLHVGGCG